MRIFRPKISIITPTFNSDKYIAETLASISEQNYSNIEHIVVDGLSTDKTCSIVAKYAQENTYVKFISEPDNGMYDAINKGLQMATGDIIFCLNSDDVLFDADVISNVVQVMEIHEDKLSSTIFVGDVVFTFFDGSTSARKMISVSAYDLASYGNCTFVPQPSTFFSRLLLEKTGLFNLNYRIASDYDFILRLLGNDGISFPLKFTTTSFRRHDGSLTERAAGLMKSESQEITDIWIKNSCKSYLSLYLTRFMCVVRYITKNPVVLFNRVALWKK